MTTTIKCEIPVQAGFQEKRRAVFNSAGFLLVIEDLRLGEDTPDEFDIDIEGSIFTVKKSGDDHLVIEQDRDAFIAMVFG